MRSLSFSRPTTPLARRRAPHSHARDHLDDDHRNRATRRPKSVEKRWSSVQGTCSSVSGGNSTLAGTRETGVPPFIAFNHLLLPAFILPSGSWETT